MSCLVLGLIGVRLNHAHFLRNFINSILNIRCVSIYGAEGTVYLCERALTVIKGFFTGLHTIIYLLTAYDNPLNNLIDGCHTLLCLEGHFIHFIRNNGKSLSNLPHTGGLNRRIEGQKAQFLTDVDDKIANLFNSHDIIVKSVQKLVHLSQILRDNLHILLIAFQTLNTTLADVYGIIQNILHDLHGVTDICHLHIVGFN